MSFPGKMRAGGSLKQKGIKGPKGLRGNKGRKPRKQGRNSTELIERLVDPPEGLGFAEDFDQVIEARA